ncbi:MAG: S49 family peptidase, partial [Tepidimonas sp.]|nr:S49 family peptidase [Tepidimonas sp.]
MTPSETPPPAPAIASDAVSSPAPAADPAGQGWERAVLEKLAFAALQEQRAARRWRNVWRLVWLLAFGAVAWLLYRDVVPPTPTATPHTALIELRGEIGPDAEASASNIVSALRSAFEDPGAQAVVLLIDSPGGSPVQAGIINDEIWRLKAKHDKPIYAVVEETCASAAYYVAAA